jgi:uncharacterized repeat protein (TIGR02543 family)
MKNRLRTIVTMLVVALLWHIETSYSQTDTLRFAFITDTHFGQTSQSGEILYPDVWLRKALAGIERHKAEFIMHGGDLITSSNNAAQYAMFDSVMVTAIPWYPMPGNHDISEGASATLDKITTWIQRGYGRGSSNREYYGFVKKNVGAFFVLNTQAYTSTDPSVQARADSQLAEMDSFFTANASVPKKFVCSHVPLFISTQNEDSAYFSVGPVYRNRILALMNKHNVHLYLAGHRHENDLRTDGGITVYTNTALSFQLGTGNERGYYIYTVTANSVKRDFYPLSQEPNVVRWKWVAYGDTRTNDVAHRQVLQAIVHNTPDYRFLFNVGDVVEDGSNTSLWNIWKAACDQILGSTGQTSVPPKYMSVIGNHDNYLTGGATNWQTFLSGQVLQFGNNGQYFTFDYENARFIVLDSEIPDDTVQQQYFLNAVRGNTQKWLFAIWHKPIFDFGPKVYEGGIHQKWGVPFYQNGGDIFFTGHAHYYLRTKKLNLNGQMNPPLDPTNGTVQVVTGDGGAPPYTIDLNHDGNGYMVAYPTIQNPPSFYGYTELTVDGDTLFLRHFRVDNQLMDQEVYYPNFKPNAVHYHVTIQTTGSGTVTKTPPDSAFSPGVKVILKAQPSLGWKFDGWSGDLTGTTNPDTVVMDGDKNITATFSAIPAGQYEVRTNVVGSGMVVKEPSGPYYSASTVVTLRARPEAGNKFSGWTGDASGTDTVVTVTVDGHKSVTATFDELQSYRLKVRTGGHGNVTLSPAGGKYVEGTEVTLQAQPETGWELYEWLGDINGKAATQMMTVDGEKEVRAVFAKTGGSVQEFGAVHDSYVQGFLKASTNFNGDSCLRVREGSSDMNRCRTYVQFDVHNVVGNILGAVMKMRVRETGLPDGKGIGAGVYSVGTDSWTETTLKWTGAPATGSLMDTVRVSTTGTYYGWDVGTYVGGEWGGDKIVSVQVKDYTSQDKRVDFGRHEDGNGPVLAIITDTPTGVEREEVMPKQFALRQNFPNPFNPETKIAYDLPKSSWVRVKIFDVLGKEVITLVDREVSGGVHQVSWNPSSMPTGVYICRMTAGSYASSIKIVYMK